MAKIIGTVISTFEGPSTNSFNFVIKDSEGIPVRKGQFVQLKTEDGVLIARVDEVLKTNRYFMQAESVREYEKSGKPLTEVFPVDRWEYLVAKTTPLGVYDNGNVLRVSYPPSPGSRVEVVDEKILSDFLGLDVKNGLNVGKIAFHDQDAKLNLTKLFQKHIAILAISGAGKSFLTSVLIEELLERPTELGKPAIIILDPHGEYIKFKEDKNYQNKTKVFDKKSISIAVSSLSPYQIAEFMPQMSSAQRRELIRIIGSIKKRKYNFDDLIQVIKESDTKTVTKETLISWLYNLKLMRLFSKVNNPTVEELARPGQLSILDISDFYRLNEKQTIATYFIRQLFNARRSNRIPPFVFVVEEAHQFCPEGVRKEGALSKGIIETIAREGRKFHASLVLISQRPIQLSTTALSQCNTHIILRVTNPYDLDHIGRSSEGMTSDVLKMIPGMKVGEALVVGEAVNHPILIKVRQKKSKDSDKGIKLEDALLKFRNKYLGDEDIEAFM